jgi:ketose-bisphosphate aldolase
VGVILLVSEASYAGREGSALVAALDTVAQRATVPVCVQLDHVADETRIARALADGVGAVMADGSRLPADENAALVVRVRNAVPAGVGLEVELGHIEGHEDVAAAVEAGALTDPQAAAEFVVRTRPDCLAVSIGNIHGTYASAPRLDWTRLERIRDAVGDVPLSLHGASGLADEDVRRAVSLGITKVNVNTEIRVRYLEELAARLPEVTPGFRVLELNSAIVLAVAEIVDAKLELLAGLR